MAAPKLLFDFIIDEELRAGLESDYREMQICVAEGAHKAVHVLAGSIVEAVLVDYLVGAGQTTPDPLEMTFADLIAACRKARVLSQRTAELSTALKSYRNLIHAGRVKRLKERVDADGSTVAQALVAIIVREVAAKRQESYGLTAEQILTKFESDPSALGVSEHLLRDAPDKEIELLLTKVLPDRYFEELQAEYADESILEGHARLFRAAFEIASVECKRKVVARYVTVLKEEPGARVLAYEEEFFRAGDLAYIEDEADSGLVKAHLFSRIRDEPTVKLLRVAEGVGSFLTEDDVETFVDSFVRLAIHRQDQNLARVAAGIAGGEATRTPTEVDAEIMSRLDDWIEFLGERERPEAIDVVRKIRAEYELYQDIPF